MFPLHLDVKFSSFFAFRGWWLIDTFCLLLMTQRTRMGSAAPDSRQHTGWSGRSGWKEGWNNYKYISIFTLLRCWNHCSSPVSDAFCSPGWRHQRTGLLQTWILPNHGIGRSVRILHINCCLLAVITFVIWNMEHGWHFSLSFNLFVFCFRFCTPTTYFNNNNLL